MEQATDRPTILLVDDDAKILSLGQEILEHLGYQVLAAADGDRALELYRQQGDAIRVVILDYLLPSQDGYEILCRVRQLNPEAKVIMASGFFGKGEMEKFRDAGAAGLIHKPFRVWALEEEIKRVLGRAPRSRGEIQPAPGG